MGIATYALNCNIFVNFFQCEVINLKSYTPVRPLSYIKVLLCIQWICVFLMHNFFCIYKISTSLHTKMHNNIIASDKLLDTTSQFF